MSVVALAPRFEPNLSRLRDFVRDVAELVAREPDETVVLGRGAGLLRSLVAHDDWLPEEYARPDPQRYQQYLLHCDGRERFSVASFVWGPGQRTPVHDHRVWGMVGVLRGVEHSQSFARAESGVLTPTSRVDELHAGDVETFSPRSGNDIHQVSNGLTDGVSVSIHVYGANIGAVERATYDAAGTPKRFISGYANRSLPNLWDRSKDIA